VDVPHPKGQATEFVTADKLLGDADVKAGSDEANARFQRTVIWGGLTLFLAIGAILTYGWLTARPRQED
jgi:hypothetical protein